MLEQEERDWVQKLIMDSVKSAINAERQLVEAAIEKHTRGDEHIAFRAFIDDLERKRARWEKITTSILGALIIGFLYWFGSHTIEIAAWFVRNAK